LDLYNLIVLKQLKLLELIEVILLFFVNILDEFDILDDGHVHKETIKYFFISLKIVVVNLDH
jgi:hypothetical protein